MENAEFLSLLDIKLAEHQFSNSSYIVGQMHVAVERRIAKIASESAGAEKLSEALSRASFDGKFGVLGNTALRCSINHALAQIASPNDHCLPQATCNEVLEIAAVKLATGQFRPIVDGLQETLGDSFAHCWIWDEEKASGKIADTLRWLVMNSYHGQLCTPTGPELEVLIQGARLAEKILPNLSRSALNHVHLIGVFAPDSAWKSAASSSTIRLSGTVFLSKASLKNPWSVAEHIFHEALHQQIYDLRQSHSVLCSEDEDRSNVTVHSLWNMPPNNTWNTGRALAAYHVYVFLSLFYAIAKHRRQVALEFGSLTDERVRTRYLVALARAHYLGEQLESVCAANLGPAGHAFLAYLKIILESLDPNPPPQGAIVHLLLDRFAKEAHMLRKHFKSFEAQEIIASCCRDLISRETEIFNNVFSRMGLVYSPIVGAGDTRVTHRGALEDLILIRKAFAETLLKNATNHRLSLDLSIDRYLASNMEESSAVLAKIFKKVPLSTS